MRLGCNHSVEKRSMSKGGDLEGIGCMLPVLFDIVRKAACCCMAENEPYNKIPTMEVDIHLGPFGCLRFVVQFR